MAAGLIAFFVGGSDRQLILLYRLMMKSRIKIISHIFLIAKQFCKKTFLVYRIFDSLKFD